MNFSFIKKLFHKKDSIESEILKYTGQPYIIFSKKGQCIKRHPKIIEVLLDLGFGENELRYRESLINGLKNQELRMYDQFAKKILQEHLIIDDSSGFSVIAERAGVYMLVQVRDLDSGSYALFRDVTLEYKLLKAGQDKAEHQSLRSLAGNV